MSDESKIEQQLVPPPKIRNKKGKRVDEKQRSTIIDLYLDLKKGNEKISYNKAATILSEKTGIGFLTVRNTISFYESKGAVLSVNTSRKKPSIFDKIDEYDREAIRRKVHSFYFEGEYPTIKKVLDRVNEDPELPCYKFSTFEKILKLLHFKHPSRRKNSSLTEGSDITIWRRGYLRKLKQYREENRKIYYLDETWINKYLLITHIGSESGFVPGGLSYDEMNSSTFLEWFTRILPKLDDNSVIVMDDAPYHLAKAENIPNIFWLKKDIINWLLDKRLINEGDEESLIKPELLAIVKSNKHQFDKYLVDIIAENVNKTVLRLPPYHCELNAIQTIWATIKHHIKIVNVQKLNELKVLVYQCVAQIPPEMWCNSIQHVQKLEKIYWDLDDIMDEMTDAVPVVNNDSETDTSDEESAE